MIAGIMIQGILMLESEISVRLRVLQDLNEQAGVFISFLEEEKEISRSIGEIEKEISLILTLKDQGIQGSRIMKEISAVLPSDVKLTQLSVSEEKGLVISGITESNSSIAQFMVNLENSRYFEEVRLSYIKREDNKGETDTLLFELAGELEGRD
jgi:Tfp pilus assembly protein PilN